MGAAYVRSASTPESNDGVKVQPASIRRGRKPSSQKSEETESSWAQDDVFSEMEPSKKPLETSFPALKKRSQSLDAGRQNQHKKLIGNRVEKFRRKSRKKSVDSLEDGCNEFGGIERIALGKGLKGSITEEETEGDLDEQPKDLTDKQKEIIKDTWKILEQNVAKVGVVLFMGLFETHPDVQEVFLPFRGLASNELRESRQLRSHALRVMGFVEKAVSRLDRPDKLIGIIEESGKNHCNYGVKPSHLELVGPQFLLAIKPTLEEHWTNEAEESWSLFMATLTYVMKKALINAKKGGQKKKGKDGAST